MCPSCLVEGPGFLELEWNQILSPMGPVWARPPKILMRWRAFPLRTYTHNAVYVPIRKLLCAPMRTIRTVRMAFGYFQVFEPKRLTAAPAFTQS